MTRLTILLLPLAIAGCGRNPAADVNALDQALMNGVADADGSAQGGPLADRIKVDPARTARSGAPAAATATAGKCKVQPAYDIAWSTRLPAHTPLPRDARVAEAAGTDAPGCGLRVVSFASGQAPERLAGWYGGLVRQAGYSFEAQRQGPAQVLGGTRGENGYVITLTQRPDGGSDVDLVTSVGR